MEGGGTDCGAQIMHLNDSGTQVPISLFIESWGTSYDQMIVTVETS
jgi:hypothetical protein